MYVGKGIENLEQTIKILKSRDYVEDIFCICVDKAGNNLMEIIHSKEIIKTIYTRKKYIIIGLAKGKRESFELVRDIITEYWTAGKLDALTVESLSKSNQGFCWQE